MKRLFAAAAVAPLCFAASQASAQTTINEARTTPVLTSTTGDLTLGSSGAITLSSGVGITVDSNSTAKIDGAVVIRDAPTATGILVDVPAGGRTSTITVNGILGVDDTVAEVDSDNDGDPDGPFVTAGFERYGVRVSGPGVFTGDVILGATSEVGVKGNNGSASVLIDAPMVGNVTMGGVAKTVGTNAYGLHVTGPLTGAVTVSGNLAAQGEGAVGMALDGPVSGAVKVEGSIYSTGYRYIDRSTEANQKLLDADDLLQGGSAVRIGGSLAKGFVLYAPALDADTTSLDEDADGIEDSKQTQTGQIIQYGSAPALQIGGASPITLGIAGTGAYNGYGVSLRGAIATNGVYNGFSATGVQIGGMGGTVGIADGVYLRGKITAISFYANATGLRFGAGANTFFRNDGQLLASNLTKDETGTFNSVAVDLEAGANVPSIVNNGEISSILTGPKGAGIAIRDASGNLTSVTNTNRINGQALSDFGVSTVGRGVALDLSANTSGVTFIQKAGAATVTALTNGDILLGSGSDFVDLQSGSIFGNLSFGAGNDAFTLTHGSVYRGEISKGAGNLAIDVSSGLLSLANRGAFNASSLNLGADSSLLFSADPENADPALSNGRINVSGTATLQQGSRISLTFRSKIDAPRAFTVIEAGNLVNNGANLLAGTPFIYSATLSTTSTSAVVNARRRTADELGLLGGRAAAYDAFYSVFDLQTDIADAVFSKTDQASFNNLYNQFLPDYSGGVFRSLALSTRGVMQAQAEDVEDMPASEPRSWLQEISSGVSQKSTTEIGYHANGFGIAGGYETPLGAGGAVAGVSAAILNSEIRHRDSGAGSVFSVNTAMVGGYWRNKAGGVLLDASVNAGYLWVDSERAIVDLEPGAYTALNSPATADWSGALASARFGASYLYKAGAFYIRPEAVLDYIYLSESGYTEVGAGPAVNLQVDSRSSYEASAEAGLTFGAKFGRNFRWSPELRVAYRARLAGSIDDTTARFVADPSLPFVLPALQGDDGRMIVRAALRAGGAYSNMALEASGEYGDLYRAYMARFIIRFLF